MYSVKRIYKALCSLLPKTTHFPIAQLPDELIELILRLIISNYDLCVLQKLLENVPDLKRKVILVSDTEMNCSYYQPLLNISAGHEDVPRMDLSTYERFLSLSTSAKPLLTVFSFYSYHLEDARKFNLLTRFHDDCPYAKLIDKQSVILMPGRIGGLAVHLTYWLWNDCSSTHYISVLAAAKGARLFRVQVSTQCPWPSDSFPMIIGNPCLSRYTGSTLSEITSINQKYRFRSTRAMYLSNIQTELRHGHYNTMTRELLSWKREEDQFLRNLRVQMNENCAPHSYAADQGRCVQRLVELGETTGFDNLHIEFLSPKMPLVVDTSRASPRPGWRTTSNLIIDNLNWHPETPFGKVCDAHAGAAGMDQHCWSVDERDQDDDPWRIKCDLMVLIGITDRVLEYSRWKTVRLLYWKRLEPTTRVNNYYVKSPAVIDCPSLTQLKIFSITRSEENTRAHLPQFNAPVLETLVLVCLKDSEQCWDIKRLLNYQWPKTLIHLTLSAHHTCEGNAPPVSVMSEAMIQENTGLTHLTLQRMFPGFLRDRGITLSQLYYLELDITAIEPTITDYNLHELAIQIQLTDRMFPSLETVILSVPDKASGIHNYATPVRSVVPKTCNRVGVACILSISTVKVNGERIDFPSDFKARAKREVFSVFVRSDRHFVYAIGEDLMAELGRPLDTCLETQWENFDLERRSRY